MPLLSVSHRQQRQQADCLAACAAMVLDYLHVPVNYPRLLRRLRVEAIGTSFRALRALEAWGLSVRIEEGDLAQLRAHLENGLPVVVFVNTGQLTSYWTEQTDHAVLVVGMEEERVYLHDPAWATAPHSVPLEEFALAWQDKDNLYAVIGLAPV